MIVGPVVARNFNVTHERICILTEQHALSPYFVAAITIGVRILGPALGFILGSLCTMIYADLSANPQITPTDPRWVGAWWLGKLKFLLLIASYVPTIILTHPSSLPSSLLSELKVVLLNPFATRQKCRGNMVQTSISRERYSSDY